MNIGITVVIYNGYGRFLNDFLRSIAQLKTPPAQVTVVLGKDHQVDASTVWPPKLKVVLAETETDLGKLKNLAVENTPTEWIMAMSVDDELTPWAIDEFERHTEADIIVSMYIFRGKKALCRHPVISKEVLLGKDYYLTGKSYMHGSTPFRRKLWEKYGYHEGDCYNSMFWIDCAAGDATFSHTDIPCLVYNKWDGSHSSVPREKRLERFKTINNYRKSKI